MNKMIHVGSKKAKYYKILKIKMMIWEVWMLMMFQLIAYRRCPIYLKLNAYNDKPYTIKIIKNLKNLLIHVIFLHSFSTCLGHLKLITSPFKFIYLCVSTFLYLLMICSLVKPLSSFSLVCISSENSFV